MESAETHTNITRASRKNRHQFASCQSLGSVTAVSYTHLFSSYILHAFFVACNVYYFHPLLESLVIAYFTLFFFINEETINDKDDHQR